MQAQIPFAAVIMAGGEATRLGGVTKPMIHVGHAPFLAYLVARLLREPTCREVVIAAGRRSEIAEFFREWPRVRVLNAIESFGTGGDLGIVATGFVGDGAKLIVAMNGDTVVESLFKQVPLSFDKDFWNRHDALVLLTKSGDSGIQNWGAFHVGPRGLVLHSDESGRPIDPRHVAEVRWRGSSTGVVIYHKRTFFGDWGRARGAPLTHLSTERDCLPRLIRHGRVCARSLGNARVLDFGTPERLAELKKLGASYLRSVYGKPEPPEG